MFFDNRCVVPYYLGMLDYFNSHCHFISASTLIPNNVGAVNNAAQMSEWKAVIGISQNNTNICGAIGVHPWYVSDLPDDWDKQLQEILIQYTNLTVGEIGLDIKRENIEKQIDVFVRQLELANSLKRGVHIHCVGAWDKMKNILKEQKYSDISFVLFHRFNGVVSDWLGIQNVYFSYSPTHSYQRILSTPKNLLLLETDSDNVADIIWWSDKVAQDCNIPKESFVNNATRMLKND